MLDYLKCVAEAVLAKGVRGLLDMVPGGAYLQDVAADAAKRLREGRTLEQIREDVQAAAAASFEEARRIAERVTRDAAGAASPEERLALELYLTQLPGAARKSLRRVGDPTGRTAPSALALATRDGLLRLLPPSVPHLRPGQLLPRRRGWRLVEPLGVGGFGEVWKAGHNLIEEPRAVKFCTAPAAGRLLAHEQELILRVIGECHDPHVIGHIVAIADAELTGDTPWLAYEYVGGGDLTTLILTWHDLPAAERVDRATEALRVLATTAGHFHTLTRPIVHRDLKPANVLVAADGTLKVTDFGIGGIAAGVLLGGPVGGSLLAGSCTPIYASPEQRAGGPADPRDDVHALGVIAFQMLTGQVETGPGPRFDRDPRAVGVPNTLIDLVGDCVDPDPHRRPANGTALAARLLTLPTGARSG